MIYVYQKFIKFLNTIVHLFRNIVTHGIELPDVRILKGKVNMEQ